MTARTHDAFAFASLITVATLSPPETVSMPTAFACIVGNVVGGLLPDIDQASNRLWDLLPAGNYLGKIFRRLFLSHRTISHSLLGVFLFSEFLKIVLPIFLNPDYINPHMVYLAVMIGLVSHLAADALTKEGIPLFFPLKIKIGFPPFSFLRVTTDSWVEKLVVLPGIGAYVFWFIGHHQSEALALIEKVARSG